ncbi:unnamed protein product, partial [Allacma fusca]
SPIRLASKVFKINWQQQNTESRWLIRGFLS